MTKTRSVKTAVVLATASTTARSNVTSLPILSAACAEVQDTWLVTAQLTGIRMSFTAQTHLP